MFSSRCDVNLNFRFYLRVQKLKIPTNAQLWRWKTLSRKLRVCDCLRWEKTAQSTSQAGIMNVNWDDFTVSSGKWNDGKMTFPWISGMNRIRWWTFFLSLKYGVLCLSSQLSTQHKDSNQTEKSYALKDERFFEDCQRSLLVLKFDLFRFFRWNWERTWTKLIKSWAQKKNQPPATFRRNHPKHQSH